VRAGGQRTLGGAISGHLPHPRRYDGDRYTDRPGAGRGRDVTIGPFLEGQSMIIIFGQRRSGKVDEIPGLCYVHTQFFHVYYVPLIPLMSYIVLAGSETGQGFRGVRTSLSFKSILVSWVRTAAVLATIGGIIGAIVYGVAFADSQSSDALER